MGTRWTSSYSPSEAQDHPHAYGDKQLLHSGRFDPRGSSPRVWGQEFLEDLKMRGQGIIPTRMGTSDFYAYFAIAA